MTKAAKSSAQAQSGGPEIQEPLTTPGSLQYVLSAYGEFAVFALAVVAAAVGFFAWQADKKIAEYDTARNDILHRQAEEKIAELNAEAASAKRDLGKARSAIETARAQVAVAQERTAKAEEKTERLRASITWRVLDEDKALRFRVAINRVTAQLNVQYVMGDPEGTMLALQIANILKDIGWDVRLMGNTLAHEVSWGVFIIGEFPEKPQLEAALFAAGLSPVPREKKLDIAMSYGSKFETAPTLFIGVKPVFPED